MWKVDSAHAEPTLAHAVWIPIGHHGRAINLGDPHCVQLAVDKKKPIVLIFVDLKKAFNSLPTHVIIKQLIDLLRGSNESFIMERGVQQGSKEGPMLFNITFKLVLEEVYNLATQMGITLVATNGEEWKLGHIEYADDLCLIANTIAKAEGLLQRLDAVLANFHMEMVTDKTQWICLGEEPEVKALSESTRTDNWALRSIPVQTKARLIEIFNQGQQSGLSPAQYCPKSDSWPQLQEDTQGKEMAKKVPLKCPAAIIQQGRLSIWIGLSKQKHGLTQRLLGSCLRDQADKKRAHTKCWNRQLQADAKELFSGDVKDWLANPCSKIPENDQHKHNLVGSRPQIVKCSNLNCTRWFARRVEMLRHVKQDHGAKPTTERAKLSCPVTGYHKQYKVRGEHLWVKAEREEPQQREIEDVAALPTFYNPNSRDKSEASTEMFSSLSHIFPTNSSAEFDNWIPNPKPRGKLD
ncbi:hypothetical protein ACTXT7_004587 [Hymenolepis weldensis]